MVTPVQFMNQYRNLKVPVPFEDSVRRLSTVVTHTVQLRKYFMMNWNADTEESKDYSAVTGGGSPSNAWFQANKEAIRTAAMGKGGPSDYELAMEWAVRSGKVSNPTQASLLTYCDEHLGIDCSGFVTNYLIANQKRTASSAVKRNTSAASYYSAAKAVNDPARIAQGDLLVWMTGNAVKTDPGHVAVVESYVPQSKLGGNMRVVEATGAAGATPKLLDSMYTVEHIIPKAGAVPATILVVKRHGVSGSRVVVIRP